MTSSTAGHATVALGVPALLRVIQLSCPSLPIGAYAYSQGLETAVERHWVTDEETASAWITGLLAESIARLDLPILSRAHAAWLNRDPLRIRDVSRWLIASRESRELQEEERHLGTSIARVLVEIGVGAAEPWIEDEDATFVVLFALGAVHFAVPEAAAAAAYCFAWTEHQVSAATRLIPLGQMAAQRVLSRALQGVPEALDRAAGLDDDSVGYFAPAQSMASALHETQRVRLFRS